MGRRHTVSNIRLEVPTALPSELARGKRRRSFVTVDFLGWRSGFAAEPQFQVRRFIISLHYQDLTLLPNLPFSSTR
jgi:hypothetical protein